MFCLPVPAMMESGGWKSLAGIVGLSASPSVPSILFHVCWNSLIRYIKFTAVIQERTIWPQMSIEKVEKIQPRTDETRLFAVPCSMPHASGVFRSGL